MESSLGSRIQTARKAQGLGLNEAARQCLIAPQKLADAEAGKDSRASTVAAIARGLTVSSDWLLGLVPGDHPIRIASNAIQAADQRRTPADATPLVRPEAIAARVDLLTETMKTLLQSVVGPLAEEAADPEVRRVARELRRELDAG